jgi:adenosine kinase
MQPTGMTAKDILDHTPAIITTLGEKGAMVCHSGGDEFVPATPPTRVYDPTGAGDAFRAGLIKGLAEGKDMVLSAKMGSVSASFAVEQHGTQEHVYSVAEYWSRYEAHF